MTQAIESPLSDSPTTNWNCATLEPELGVEPTEASSRQLEASSGPLELDAVAMMKTAKVMIVDDEAFNIKVVQTHLSHAGYKNFITATDPTRVLDTLTHETPDILLLDIMMPRVSGLDILRDMRKNDCLSHIPTVILSAADNEEIRLEALELGATDFLSKPVNLAELVVRVRNVLLVKAYQDELRNYAGDLAQQVRKRTAELAASRLELIHCLARTAEFRDNETGRHVVRVGRYSEIIAEQLGLDAETIELVAHAAPLHDMGKVGIPDSILLKPGKLTPEEFEIMQRHSIFGKQTFEPMSHDEWQTFKSHTVLGEMIMDVKSSPFITMASTIALTHHEKWDGTGYPLGLAGEDIPLPGRIVAVADVFDALTSRRPYKPALPLNRSFEIMEEGRGVHFDPRVLDAFLARREAIVAVLMEFADIE